MYFRRKHSLREMAFAAFTAASLASSPAVSGSGDAYIEYIEGYSAMAVEQQELFGIPASITLAQGLLESGAGKSTLATEGNNHFGIKCHSGWKGPTMIRSDDRPDDCFRVYGNAAESFADHSRFLTRSRYAPLFELDPTDYAAWARTLRKCGYATDPNYADKLITIIERYSLYSFDTAAGRKAEENIDFIAETLRSTHPVRRSRGLHYVVALPGDTYASIAKEFHMKTKKLMGYNDVSRDTEIKPWQEVYLQEKHDEAPDGDKWATIGEGESLHSLSQRFGMKVKTLRELNRGIADKAGERVRLRK